MADPLSLYKRVAAVLEPLTPELLVARMQQNRALLWQLVGRLPFQLPASIDEDDILQEASLAVVRAFKTHDSSRGTIEAWLAFTVRTHVRVWLREMHPMSRHCRSQIREALAAFDLLQQRFHRCPTDPEVAAQLGWSVGLLRDVLGAAPARALLAAEHILTPDTRQRERVDEPFEQAWRAECQTHLKAGLKNLSEREREILSLHYFSGLSLREIAARLGLPKSTIIWTHHNALMRLRVTGVTSGAVESRTARHASSRRSPPVLGALLAAVRRMIQTGRSEGAAFFSLLLVLLGLSRSRSAATPQLIGTVTSMRCVFRGWMLPWSQSRAIAALDRKQGDTACRQSALTPATARF